jgi:quercetin dioxygenase-like cupin family protein
MKVRQSILAPLALAVFTMLVADPAAAQAPAIKRTLLQRIDVGDNREAILGLAEIPAGGAAGRHTHPGVEFGYVVEGSASLEVEGETPKLLKAGDSYTIPMGKIHDAKTVGDKPVKVLATYVVEKGKPLATPAP